MEIKIALAGNPNCGKTTLFNALTGSNQFVGNWPGVTVEKKEGKLKRHEDVIITDLPGIYSLSPYTLEEVVARNYLLEEHPDVILNIIDATNLERNLYLTTQLTELGIPVVAALNFMDVMAKRGDKIDLPALEKAIGCRIVEISALKGDGIDEAAEAAIAAAGTKPATPPHAFSGVVEHALAHIEEAVLHELEPRWQRWYSIKIFERDEKAIERLGLTEDRLQHLEEDIRAAESELDDDAESIITNERYNYIEKILKGIYTRRSVIVQTVSDKIDRVVTNRVLALPIFALVMFLVYFISITTVGTWVTDFTNDGLFGDGFHLFGIKGDYEEAVDENAAPIFDNPTVGALISAAADNGVAGAEELLSAYGERDFGSFEEAYGLYGAALSEAGYSIDVFVEPILESAPDPAEYGVWVPGVGVLVGRGLEAINCADWLTSLIVDGIVGGVGAVLGFVPQMLVLFLLLAFLEACGYMSRIAFVMDRLFRKFGLSGKSFIPMLVGSGCGVPGIMASRTIENERDRRMTIMTTTFIPCGAKMPIIALIAAAMFGNSALIAISAYLIGMAAVVVSGLILKKTKMFAGDPSPFVMELPAYHLPTLPNLLHSMWERGWSFIKKAGTVILLSSIIIWVGSTVGMHGGSFGWSADMALESSILGYLGGAFVWLFKPLGFGNIKAAVATLMGLVAKEEVVAVFGVLDFTGFTRLSAFSFLIFNLLCAPCFAAMGAIRREMNSAKWTAFAITYQCVLAYAVSLCIYQLGMVFSGNFGWHILGAAVAVAIIAFVVYMLARPYKEATRLDMSEVKAK